MILERILRACHVFVRLTIGWLSCGGVLGLSEGNMLLDFYLAAFSLFNGLSGSRLCLLCTFCWMLCGG